MSKVFINEETLVDIGNAIREKEGSSELIPPLEMGDRIRAIAGALAEINGYSYVCGTVSFETDQISDVIIDHKDVGETKAIFVWCDSLTAEEVAYKAMTFYIPNKASDVRWYNSGSFYVKEDGTLLPGNAATRAAYALYYETSTRFCIGASDWSGCRLLAGKTYHWIVIGGGVK